MNGWDQICVKLIKLHCINWGCWIAVDWFEIGSPFFSSRLVLAFFRCSFGGPEVVRWWRLIDFRKGECGSVWVMRTGFSLTREFFWRWVVTIGVMDVVFQWSVV